MSKPVPYLSGETIERDAAALLAEYAQARGVIIAPPIPIEDIVEKHLKLGIEFDDTHRRFGVPRESGQDPDILGAMFFDAKRIVMKASTRRRTRRRKAAIVSHSAMRAGIGACTATCSLRNRRSLHCLARTRFRPWFAGRARPRSRWSGRRIFTPHAS